MHASHHNVPPPALGADLRAALVASCLRGALPPVDLRAVCLVRAMGCGGVEERGNHAGVWQYTCLCYVSLLGPLHMTPSCV